MTRLAFGFMTGTSLDGLDGAAVRFAGRGLALELVDIRATVTLPFPSSLEDALLALCEGRSLTARDVAAAARALGELHADAARDLIALAGQPDLACAHGQTVFHAPPDSWQLLNPWPLALAAGCPVVYDLRGADLALAGQGAPLTPVADWTLFRHATERRAIVNLGGFCNATLLPAGAKPGDVRGMDVCACNHALNAAARLALNAPFDRDGAEALRGGPNDRIVKPLAALLRAQRDERRSLGTGDELAPRLEALRESAAPADFLASVVSAAAHVIGETLAPWKPDRVLLAGGSARNQALVRSLLAALPGVAVDPLDALGVPATHREAVEFAALGALCADRTPITLPAITGARAPSPISGAWIDPRP
jgi:anhydro-N-acetylmuramic acid kinase